MTKDGTFWRCTVTNDLKFLMNRILDLRIARMINIRFFGIGNLRYDIMSGEERYRTP